MPQHGPPGNPHGKGGRIPPDGRQPAAKGVGKNAKRHDLERPATPGLHGSDLQQGDVQMMQRGQRVQPIQEQGPAGPPPAPGRGQRQQGRQQGGGVQTPDPIEFFGNRSGGSLQVPVTGSAPTGGKLEKWQPVIEALVASPGSSGGLAVMYLNQLRQLRQQGVNRSAAAVNLRDIDDGLEAMVAEMEG